MDSFTLYTSQSKLTQCEEHGLTWVTLTADFHLFPYDELNTQSCMDGLFLLAYWEINSFIRPGIK